MKIAKLAIIVLLLQFLLSNFRPAPYFFSFEQFFFETKYLVRNIFLNSLLLMK